MYVFIKVTFFQASMIELGSDIACRKHFIFFIYFLFCFVNFAFKCWFPFCYHWFHCKITSIKWPASVWLSSCRLFFFFFFLPNVFNVFIFVYTWAKKCKHSLLQKRGFPLLVHTCAANQSWLAAGLWKISWVL